LNKTSIKPLYFLFEFLLFNVSVARHVLAKSKGYTINSVAAPAKPPARVEYIKNLAF